MLVKMRPCLPLYFCVNCPYPTISFQLLESVAIVPSRNRICSLWILRERSINLLAICSASWKCDLCNLKNPKDYWCLPQNRTPIWLSECRMWCLPVHQMIVDHLDKRDVEEGMRPYYEARESHRVLTAQNTSSGWY